MTYFYFIVFPTSYCQLNDLHPHFFVFFAVSTRHTIVQTANATWTSIDELTLTNGRKKHDNLSR